MCCFLTVNWALCTSNVERLFFFLFFLGGEGVHFFNKASQIVGPCFNSSNLCHSLRVSAKLGPAMKQYRISNSWSEIVQLVSEQSKNCRTLSCITPESFKQEYLLCYARIKQACNGKAALEISIGKLKQSVIENFFFFFLKSTKNSSLSVRELMELTLPTKLSELIQAYISGNILSIK